MPLLGNQKVIVFKRELEGLDALKVELAAKNLNGGALKLYLYFCSQPSYKELAFSPAIFCERYGISNSSEKQAFKTLLNFGYLKQIDERKYCFIDEIELD